VLIYRHLIITPLPLSSAAGSLSTASVAL